MIQRGKGVKNLQQSIRSIAGVGIIFDSGCHITRSELLGLGEMTH
jgi:hypothetical protein